MKKFLLMMFVLLLGTTMMQAQTTKAERLKYIRKVYAEAKQKMAENGKDGRPRLDLTIEVNDGEKLQADDGMPGMDSDEDFYMIEETKTTYYYDKVRRFRDGSFFDDNECYLVIENWSAQGHTRYKEVLFDPENGSLLFYYSHYETDAGMPFDSRFYYDEQGNVIEQLHKVMNQDAADEYLEDMKSDQNGKPLAEHYHRVFNGIVAPQGQAPRDGKGSTTPKANRMNFIRTAYAQARQKVEEDAKTPMPRNVKVTWHNQEDGDTPPVTTEIKYYLEHQPQGETFANHCYFITKRTRSMSIDFYNEYLLSPKSHDLIFSYGQYKEEGSKNEFRYYFDENGQCIERKATIQPEEGYDDSLDEKKTAFQYIAVLKEIINSAM